MMWALGCCVFFRFFVFFLFVCFFLGGEFRNMKMDLYYLSFVNTAIIHVVEIVSRGRPGLTCLKLLVSWWHRREGISSFYIDPVCPEQSGHNTVKVNLCSLSMMVVWIVIIHSSETPVEEIHQMPWYVYWWNRLGLSLGNGPSIG